MNNKKQEGKFIHEMSDEEKQKWKKALQEVRKEFLEEEE
jgi:ClpP class serine protease|tara:strand:- start:1126 stop:1242 length:117 start_codon:yes stop_codon:yes gene_type:complete